MKIAFVSFDFGEYTVRHASALAEKAQVALFAPEPLVAPHLFDLHESVELHTFRKPRLRQFAQQIGVVLEMVRQIKAFQPDVIHFQHGQFWFNWVLPLLWRYPLVVTVHDPQPHVGDRSSRKTPKWLMEFGYRRADQIIVHGNQLKKIVVDQIGFPAKLVHMVPMIALGDASAHPDVQEQANTILFFGRIWEYKGLAYLIKAEPLISAKIPDLKIVIAGQGEDMQHYRQMMVHPERFELHNQYIADDQVARYFRQACLVVLPYIEATQSAVIPIAYAFSKPVVATPVGSLPDLVEDGKTGLMVPPRDEQALADAIIRLLQDSDLRKQMGINGNQKLNSESSPSAVARQTLAVYQAAIQAFHAYPAGRDVQYSYRRNE